MKKLGLIVLAVIMALGLVGVAFASWTQNLTISNQVLTGTLSAKIEAYGPPDPPSATPAYVVVTYTPGLGTSLNVQVTGAVPGAVISVPYQIYNDGNIPCNVTWVSGPSDITNFTNYTDNNGWAGTTDLAVGGSYVGTITFTVAAGVSQNQTYSTSLTITVTPGS